MCWHACLLQQNWSAFWEHSLWKHETCSNARYNTLPMDTSNDCSLWQCCCDNAASWHQVCTSLSISPCSLSLFLSIMSLVAEGCSYHLRRISSEPLVYTVRLSQGSPCFCNDFFPPPLNLFKSHLLSIVSGTQSSLSHLVNKQSLPLWPFT